MATSAGFDPATCTYVAGGETTLRCAKCERPLLVKDAKRTPTGYVCPNFVRGRVATFYSAGTAQYLIAGVVAFLGGLVAGVALSLISGIGFFALWIMFPAAPAIGGALAEVVRRAVGKKRGRYIWLVTVIASSLGAAIILLAPGLLAAILGRSAAALLGGGGLFGLLGLFLMQGTVIYRLRI